MHIFAGFIGEGASNESVVVENGDFRFFRSLSSEHFTYRATRQLSHDTTVNDLGDISRSLVGMLPVNRLTDYPVLEA